MERVPYQEIRLQNGKCVRAGSLLVPVGMVFADSFGYGDRIIGVVAVSDERREITTVSVKRPARGSMHKHALRVLAGLLKEARNG